MDNVDRLLTLKNRIVALEDISGGGGGAIKELEARVSALEKALGNPDDLPNIPEMANKLSEVDQRVGEVEKYAKPVNLTLSGDLDGTGQIVTGEDTEIECSLGDLKAVTLRGKDAKDVATISVDPKNGPTLKYKSKVSGLGNAT